MPNLQAFSFVVVKSVRVQAQVQNENDNGTGIGAILSWVLTNCYINVLMTKLPLDRFGTWGLFTSGWVTLS